MIGSLTRRGRFTWSMARGTRPRAVPYQIAGLAADYDFDTLIGSVADGAAITTLNDSAGDTHVGHTGSNRPTFDESSPFFNGHACGVFAKASTQYLFASSGSLITALSGADKPFTIFAVVRRSTKITVEETLCAFGNSASATPFVFHHWRFANGNSQRWSCAISDGTQTLAQGFAETTDLSPQVLAVAFNGTDSLKTFVVAASLNPFYDSFVAEATADASARGAMTFNRFSIGALVRNTVSLPADCEIARVLVYTRELTDAERKRVCDYLYGRYIEGDIDSPADLSGLDHWWDANQLAGSFGSDVDTWEDLVGSLDFSAAGFDAPIVAAHDDGVKKTVLFRGTDDAMDTAAASDGNFLHNDSASTFAVVYRVEAVDEITQPIVDTNGNSTTARGFSLIHDGVSGAHSLQVKIGNGTTNVADHDSQDYGDRPGQWHVALIVHNPTIPSSEEDYHVWLDNEHYASFDAANAENAGDAVGPLTLGKLAGAATYGKIQIAEIVHYNRALGSPGEIQKLMRHFAAKWQTGHVALVGGNGLANILNDATPHRAFPGLLWTQAGHAICAFRRGANHGSSAGVMCISTSADGLRWSDERVIYDDSANYDCRGAYCFTQIASGRIFLGTMLNETDSDLLPYTAGLLISDDNGGTWQGPFFVSKATDTWFDGLGSDTGLQWDEGPNSLIELPDGSLLLHFAATVNGMVFPHIVQCRSFDDGETWVEHEPIWYARKPLSGGNFPDDELAHEMSVLRFADGELLMGIRGSTNERIYFARSTDNGETWSPSDFTDEFIAGHGNVRMILDPNDPDGAFLFHRQAGITPIAVWRHTGDRGATWTDPQPMSNLSATTTINAYGSMTYAFASLDSNDNAWVTVGLEEGDDSDIFVRRWENAAP